MFAKKSIWVAVAFATILSLIGAVAAFAGAPSGNGPDAALAPSNGWVQLSAGQQQWFAFQYAGPDDNGNRPVATAVLMANPASAVTFNVWDANRLADYASGDPNAKAVGAGTLHPVNDGSNSGEDRYNGNLAWSGGFGMAGTYYIQVVNNGDAPATYTLQFAQQ